MAATENGINVVWFLIEVCSKRLALSSAKALKELIPQIEEDHSTGDANCCCSPGVVSVEQPAGLIVPALLLLLLLLFLFHSRGTKYQRSQSFPSKSAVPSQHSNLVPKPCQLSHLHMSIPSRILTKTKPKINAYFWSPHLDKGIFFLV